MKNWSDSHRRSWTEHICGDYEASADERTGSAHGEADDPLETVLLFGPDDRPLLTRKVRRVGF